jgi:hypothetical protein
MPTNAYKSIFSLFSRYVNREGRMYVYAQNRLFTAFISIPDYAKKVNPIYSNA